MCEANVYYVSESGEEQLILEAVDKLLPSPDGKIKMVNIFSQTKTVEAVIRGMNLLEHRIVIEKR